MAMEHSPALGAAEKLSLQPWGVPSGAEEEQMSERGTLTILCRRWRRRRRMNSLCWRDTKLTAAYSSRAANTKSRHTAIQMSMAFT